MLQVVPKEQPRLHLKIYTKIFEHFLEIKEYNSFKLALSIFPTYMINQEHLIELVNKEIAGN